MQAMTLSNLKTGDHAVIQEIQADKTIQQRLSSMGLRKGKEACLIRRGRFGGPLQIRIGSVCLIIRSKDAAQVEVNLIA